MHIILLALHKARGRVVTNAALADQVWPLPQAAPFRALHIASVRIYDIRQRMKAAGLNPDMIVNRLGEGYFLASAELVVALRRGQRRRKGPAHGD